MRAEVSAKTALIVAADSLATAGPASRHAERRTACIWPECAKREKYKRVGREMNVVREERSREIDAFDAIAWLPSSYSLDANL